MVDGYITNEEDALSYSGIVHKLLSKITTELSVREFRGGYSKTVIINGIPCKEYIPDARAEYIQGVESLSDLLLPNFDKKMVDEYNKHEEIINKLEKEIESCNIKLGDDKYKKFIRTKLKLIRKLFQKLNLLLARTGYLKSSTHIEEMDAEE
jgi:hypothetical protein